MMERSLRVRRAMDKAVLPGWQRMLLGSSRVGAQVSGQVRVLIPHTATVMTDNVNKAVSCTSV